MKPIKVSRAKKQKGDNEKQLIVVNIQLCYAEISMRKILDERFP